jgi:hypothetical protein
LFFTAAKGSDFARRNLTLTPLEINEKYQNQSQKALKMQGDRQNDHVQSR